MEPRNYEIAYLLSSTIPEGEVLTRTGKLTSLIEDAKGVVRRVEEPRRRRLSYPVKKEREAYFGWTSFLMAPEYLRNLKKKLGSGEGFLRYLIVQQEERPMQPIRPPFFRRPVSRAQPGVREEKPEEKLDLEALDKKLEEILGK